MKTTKEKILATLLALLLLAAYGCGRAAVRPAETAVQTADPAPSQPTDTFMRYLTSQNFASNRETGKVSQAFRQAYAAFALRLLTACEAKNGDTTMVSPLSVMTALAMTANGAQGETQRQMLDVLGGLSLDELNQQVYNYTSSLSSSERAFFRAANSVWVTNRSDFHVNQSFIDVIENTYEADVISTDFSQKQKAADAINGWCKEKTNDMIPKVVAPDMLSYDTIMTLLNALCFEAKWNEPFPSDSCWEDDFSGRNGDTAVTMMHGNGDRYFEGKNETGFLKHYSGAYAFAAFLPNEGISIDDYVAGLDAETMLSLIDGAKSGEVNIRMPKFKADYSITLNDTLKSFGMELPFDPGRSDLFGLGRTDDDARLYISTVIHKTHIDVDNEGTKAAAVTAILVDETACEPEITHTVILDRPFVYAIIDTANGLPIFFGTCENVN